MQARVSAIRTTKRWILHLCAPQYVLTNWSKNEYLVAFMTAYSTDSKKTQKPHTSTHPRLKTGVQRLQLDNFCVPHCWHDRSVPWVVAVLDGWTFLCWTCLITWSLITHEHLPCITTRQLTLLPYILRPTDPRQSSAWNCTEETALGRISWSMWRKMWRSVQSL